MFVRTDEIKKIKRYKYWLLLMWTIVVVFSAIIDYLQINENLVSEAHIAAKIHHGKDILYRRWSAIRGGVYVPIDEHTQPNPHLNYIPNRDVTINGKAYTLVNPAYMTRQVYELAQKDGEVSSRLISDNAINPINQANEWEHHALQVLKTMAEHHDTIFIKNGERYLSVVRPFFTEKSCLKCHAQQGYKEGDLRGGIIISMPLTEIERSYKSQEMRLLIILGVIYLIGFGLIQLGASKIEKDFITIIETKKSLTESEAKIETYLRNAPNIITVIDKNGVIQYLNRMDDRFDNKIIIGRNISEFVGEETKFVIADILDHPDETVYNKAIEYSVHIPEGIIWYENRIAPIKSEDENIGYIIISTDITERKLLSEKIENSLKEKEVLLKEVHHRVKNNMQIITSLLNLQSSHLSDQNMIDVFKESQSRIKSMALIHEIMYQSGNFSNIDTKHYIISLVSYLYRSYCLEGNRIKITTDIDEVNLNLDVMIPCGIIITELVTNALKYAFPGSREGEINILLHSIEKNNINLTVKDNGVGIVDKSVLLDKKKLGLQLVETLTRQLKGKLNNDEGEGTSFTISFKIE
jgi:PAS domain S-box-containing protein